MEFKKYDKVYFNKQKYYVVGITWGSHSYNRVLHLSKDRWCYETAVTSLPKLILTDVILVKDLHSVKKVFRYYFTLD